MARTLIGYANLPPSRVKIEYDESYEDAGEYHDGPNGPVVTIGPSAGPKWSPTFAATVLHELLHFISDQYGMNLTERDVRTLEQTLCALFLGSPELTEEFFNSLLPEEEDEEHGNTNEH